MTTKDQERKALEQIRKIVEGLGENSYIGMAFEGCFEIAEDNINNDFGDSMKNRYERADREVIEAQFRVRSLEKELDSKNEEIAGYEKELDFATRRLSDARVRANEWRKRYNEATGSANELTAKAESMRMEIMELKAKLYDMMMAQR